MRSGVHRERLPRKRSAVTHSFNLGGHEAVLTVGVYDDGRCGEIFLDLGKEGSDVAGWSNAFCIAVSLGLQHGVPIEKFIHTFGGMKFGANGATDNEEIGSATSIPDMVMKILEKEFTESVKEG